MILDFCTNSGNWWRKKWHRCNSKSNNDGNNDVGGSSGDNVINFYDCDADVECIFFSLMTKYSVVVIVKRRTMNSLIGCHFLVILMALLPSAQMVVAYICFLLPTENHCCEFEYAVRSYTHTHTPTEWSIFEHLRLRTWTNNAHFRSKAANFKSGVVRNNTAVQTHEKKKNHRAKATEKNQTI